MARMPDNAYEWLERYEKKYKKADDNYQATGDPKYDRQVWEYRSICDAFRALVEKREKRAADFESRRSNCKWAIDRLCKASYSREEVIKMLNDAVWW